MLAVFVFPLKLCFWSKERRTTYFTQISMTYCWDLFTTDGLSIIIKQSWLEAIKHLIPNAGHDESFINNLVLILQHWMQLCSKYHLKHNVTARMSFKYMENKVTKSKINHIIWKVQDVGDLFATRNYWEVVIDYSDDYPGAVADEINQKHSIKHLITCLRCPKTRL